jgi:Zn-finger nucleic acid-binding protein
MDCPKCRSTELTQKRVADADVTIDTCPSCGGVWFDRGELERLMGSAGAELRMPDTARRSPRRCPKCSGVMYAFYYPRTFVSVDMCRKCPGIWLDRGEYTEIKTVRKHVGSETAEREAAEAGGAKGTLLRFIDTAMQALRPW